MAKASIILADDQPAVLEEIRSLLEPTFEILDMVTNGEARLEAVKRLHPDLVVVDISMPGMSGLEAARRLCKCADAPGVVFLTIHRFSRDGGRGHAIGGIGLCPQGVRRHRARARHRRSPPRATIHLRFASTLSSSKHEI